MFRSLTWIFAVVLCVTGPALIGVQAQSASWRAKTVVLNCDKGSMQQALEQVAAQARVSILAEETPAQKPLTLKAELSAEKALTQISDACDYTWSVSKSGVVLLTKRFTNEYDRPEISPAELRACAQNILAAIQAIYTPPAARGSLTAQFRGLFAELTPEQIAACHSREGLPVATLTPQLRGQAAQVIYAEELAGLYFNWNSLNEQLAALPQSSLAARQIYDLNQNRLVAVALDSRDIPIGRSRPLWFQGDADTKPAQEEPGQEELSPAAPTPLPNGMFRAGTVAEALDILHKQFRIDVTLYPQMGDRRLLLLLQAADANRAVAALAELHNWQYQEKEQAAIPQESKDARPEQSEKAQGDAKAYFMYRRALDPPRTVVEVGEAILAALPPDMARCLFTKPATLDGKPYLDFHKMYPQLPGAGNPGEFTTQKMRYHNKAAVQRLRRSLARETFAAPVPYTALTAPQKSDLAAALFTYTAQQTLNDLWTLTHRPPDWLLDPAHVSLIQRGDSYGILRADGQVGFTVRQSTTAPPGAAPQTP